MTAVAGANRAEARAAARLLTERRWLAAAAGVVLLAAVFVVLGRWQYGRHEGRQDRARVVAANYDAAPVALDEVLPSDDAPLHQRDEWRPVAVSGRYHAAGTLLVRNRPRQGRPGYEVLVPLVLDDARVLVVDRGWIPTGRTGAAPDAVPAPPGGRVDVVARLRPGVTGSGRDAPAGQLQDVDLAVVADRLGRRVLPAYGALASERPGSADRPLPPARPDPGLDINLPYALQWYAFAAAGLALLWIGAVREVRRRQAAATGGRPSTRAGST